MYRELGPGGGFSPETLYAASEARNDWNDWNDNGA